MTRKRFVKLLMAQGYSRNEANAAAQSGYKGQPYTELYLQVWLRDFHPVNWTELAEALVRTIGRAIISYAEATERLGLALERIATKANEAARQLSENMLRLNAADEGKPSE